MQLLQQAGDPVVDVLGAVVGVETQHGEGKQPQQRLQGRDQEPLRDAPHGADVLVLSHLVHQVDEVDALHAVPVALVHGVDPQIARQAVRLGARRTAMATFAARVFVHVVRLAR